VRVSVRESVCVCVCECVSECVSECVCERERESGANPLGVPEGGERLRDQVHDRHSCRERVCVSVCECVWQKSSIPETASE